MQWLQSSRPTSPKSRTSPLREESVEVFEKGLQCRVTSAISALNKGRVMVNGYSWCAELHRPDCQAILLPGQQVLAIGRRGTVLIVMPHQCRI